MDKAQAAIHLLMNELFTGELSAMKASCIQVIENSRPDQYDEREDAYRTIRVINQIIARFESIAADKQVEQKRWKIL